MRRGIDVLTATAAGILGATDVQCLAHAHRSGRVMVTNDDDFLRLHATGQAHSGIVFCQRASLTIGRLSAALVLLHAVMEPEEMAGRVEFL